MEWMFCVALAHGTNATALRMARERQLAMGVPPGLMRALEPWLGLAG